MAPRCPSRALRRRRGSTRTQVRSGDPRLLVCPSSAGTGIVIRMTEAPDPYKVLQVDSEAEDEVIQAAYRRLAQKYHPDVAPTVEAAARMAAINGAWETLRDPSRRAAHDLARRIERRSVERAAAAAERASADRAG